MKKLKLKNKNKKFKNTIINIIIVFFCTFLIAFFMFNYYANTTSKKAVVLVNEKLDKILYQIFNELITNDIINKDNVNDILKITKNSRGEILTVNYDLEKTYSILTKVSNILKDGINDLENGKIDVSIYDEYLTNGKNGLILNIPLFLASKNIFLNSLGPKIPVVISFNENILTNIKTKVNSYGFNNALLEVYIVVDMKKTIITPLKEDENKFNYEILIGALVVNGSVPSIYGGKLESSSNLFNLPLE